MKKLNKGLLIVSYILLLIASVIALYLLSFPSNDYPKVLIIIDAISIFLAFFYFASGYTKDAERYFRFTILFEALTFIIDYLYLAIRPIETVVNANFYFSLVLILILYGNVLLLALGKDLGKNTSFTICIVNICLYVYNFVTSISNGLLAILLSSIWLILSIVTLVMIEAKYIDKTNRKTK